MRNVVVSALVAALKRCNWSSRSSKVRSVAGPFPTTVAPREGFAAAVPEVRRRLEKGIGVAPALDATVDRILRELGL